MNDRRSRRSRSFPHKLTGGVLITVLLSVTIVICALVVVTAYWDFRAKNHRMQRRLFEIHRSVARLSDPNDMRDTCSWFIQRLEASTDSAAHSNTISFLFSVFSVALVSGGVYLLDKARDDVKASERAVEEVRAKADAANIRAESVETMTTQLEQRMKDLDAFVENSGILATISNAAYTSSRLRELQAGTVFDRLVPQFRDLLQSLLRDLERAVDQRLSLGKREQTRLLDQAFDIRTNLENLPDETRSELAVLYKQIERAISLIRSLSAPAPNTTTTG